MKDPKKKGKLLTAVRFPHYNTPMDSENAVHRPGETGNPDRRNTMSNNIRIVFSHAANQEFTQQPQHIALHCEIVRGDRDEAVVLEGQHIEAGRWACIRLCKADSESIDAKIAEYVESMEYNYASLHCVPAVVSVERIG